MKIRLLWKYVMEDTTGEVVVNDYKTDVVELPKTAVEHINKAYRLPELVGCEWLEG